MNRAASILTTLLGLAALAGCTTVNTAATSHEPRTGQGERSPVFIAEFTRVIEFGGIERWSARSPREPFVEVSAPEGWKDLPPVELAGIDEKTALLEGIVEVADRPYYLRVMSRSDGKNLFIWHEYLAARRIGVAPTKSPLRVVRTTPTRPTGVRMQAREALADGLERCRTLEKYECTLDGGERYEFWLDVTSWEDCGEVYGTVQENRQAPAPTPSPAPAPGPAVVTTR